MVDEPDEPDFGFVERLRTEVLKAKTPQEEVATYEHFWDELEKAGVQLGSDAETIRWAASRHCGKGNAAKIGSRLDRILALYPLDNVNTEDEAGSHNTNSGTSNSTAGKARRELLDGEKKFVPAKKLAFQWGVRIVRHYEFSRISRDSLNDLVTMSTIYNVSWESFVGLANSCMLDRHEECARGKEAARGASLRIGQRPNRTGIQNAKKAPILPCDISAIKEAAKVQRHNEHPIKATEDRAGKWINPCRVCFAKDYQQVGMVDLFALGKDANGILVPSDEIRSSCDYCTASPPHPKANGGQKRQNQNPDPVGGPLKKKQQTTPSQPRDEEPISRCKTSRSVPNTGALTSTDARTGPASAHLTRTATLKPIRVQTSKAPTRSTRPAVSAFDQMQITESTARATRPAVSREGGITRTHTEVNTSIDESPNKFTCPACNGPCEKCSIPQGYSAGEAAEIFETVHKAATAPIHGDSITSASLMSFVRFASIRDISDSSAEFPDEPGVVWRVKWKALKERLDADLHQESNRRRQCEKDGKPYMRRAPDQDLKLPQIFIIDEEFPDNYTPEEFADQLEDTFSGSDFKVSVRIDSNPTPALPIEDLTRPLRDSKKERDRVLNALSLDGIANAAKPGITRQHRLRLLERIIHRLKAKWHKHVAEKQLVGTPYDVRSCLAFNILGFQGAFSGAHRDSLGGTWLRNLFGKKIWWFVPDSEMDGEDWDKFAEDGNDWDPGKKAQEILIKEKDVLVMPRPVIHAVYTAEDCVMEGGMFWDENILPKLIEALKYTAEHKHTTNEPLALQLPEVIDALRDVVSTQWEDNSNRRAILQAIEELRGIRYTCESCSETCPCRGRRCTKWCHKKQETHELDCIIEGWDELEGIFERDHDDPELEDDSDADPDYVL